MHAYTPSLPALPFGFGTPAPTRAPYPCRKDSTSKPVKFMGMTRKDAARLWHQARRFECATRRFGRQDGAVTRNGLAVLHAFLFDFIHYATGAADAVPCDDCEEGWDQRAQREARPGGAEVGRDRQLAPPLHRVRGGWALYLAAGHQRLCGAAALAMARLPRPAPCPGICCRDMGRSSPLARRDHRRLCRHESWGQPQRHSRGAGGRFRVTGWQTPLPALDAASSA